MDQISSKAVYEGKYVAHNALRARTLEYHEIAFEKSNLSIDTFVQARYNVSHVAFYYFSLWRYVRVIIEHNAVPILSR